MSAFALASQDFAGSGSVAGPPAFSARKKAAEAADGESAGDSFDAALARSGNETPPTTSPDAGAPSARTTSATDAPADAALAPNDFARDGASWPDLPAVSGGGFTTHYSNAPAGVSPEASLARGAQADAPTLDRLAKFLGDAVGEAPSPATDEDESASARPIDRKPLVPSFPQASATRASKAATPPEKASDPSKKSAPSQAADADPAGATLLAASCFPSSLLTGMSNSMLSRSASTGAPAKTIASRLDEGGFGGSAGAPGEADSVARIGAALASVSRRANPLGGGEKSPAEARISLAAPDGAATSPIHVVAQQTWLQPVSPAFSPGLNRLAAADRAALEAPRAGKVAAPEARADAAAADVAGSAPAAGAETAPSDSFGFAFSGGAAFLAEEGSANATPAGKKTDAAPETAIASPLAATPRRDLEITLAPTDLGGLAVRMKSAGDRLEIAFLADRGETARMISDKSATLESQLHDAGLGLGGIDINAATRAEPGAPAILPASAGATANDAPANPRGNSQNAPQRQEFSDRGRQDQSHETGEKTGEPRVSSGHRGLYL